MSVFDRLNRLVPRGAPLLSFYGPPGVGKTSLAAEFPAALYLFAAGEEPPEGVDLPNMEITSFSDLLDAFEGLLNEEHEFKTVIIDSLDKIEPMIWDATMARNGWDNIDSNDKGSPTAFHKGYRAAVDGEWGEYFEAVSALGRANITVIQILHSEAKSFKDPLVDDYDRYRPKLQKWALELVVENSKGLFFINRRMSVKQVKGFGGKEQSKPEGMSGSERIIYTDERAGFMAKTRFKGMPATIPYKPGQGYAELSKYFGQYAE